MTRGRLEAFTDGVIAILITIMVLELKVPEGEDWSALRPLTPRFLTYVLSWVYLGIYWNNHHHLFHVCERINGKVLWANLYLLFWLSLVPFATGWMGENHFAPLPTAVYGVALLMPAIAYYLLQLAIVRRHGAHGALARALGKAQALPRDPVRPLGSGRRLGGESRARREGCSVRALPALHRRLRVDPGRGNRARVPGCPPDPRRGRRRLPPGGRSAPE